MRFCEFITRSIPLAALVLTACSGQSSKVSQLKEASEGTQPLKAKVYTLREVVNVGGVNQTVSTPALLVGPYVDTEGNKSYRAWEVKNCASSQAVYEILGIDGGNAANPRLISDLELRQALGRDPASDLSLSLRTTDWRLKFHLSEQTFSCTQSELLTSEWFWDLDTNSYFPNSNNPTIYTKVDQRTCPRLYDHFSARMAQGSINTFDPAADVPKPIYEMACGDESITPFRESWGWELRWANSPQFAIQGADGVARPQAFLVLSKLEGGRRQYLPIMGMQDQTVQLSSRATAYSQEFKDALNFLRRDGLRITANINDELTVETMAVAERDEFFRNIAQYPILHLCPLGAGAASCKPKLSWLKPESRPGVFSLVDGSLSLTETAKSGQTMVPLLGLGKPDAATPNKFQYEYTAVEPCAGLSIGDVFQFPKKEWPSASQSQKVNFDNNVAKIITALSRPIVPQRSFTCAPPETKVCEVTAGNEAELRQALTNPSCLPQSTDLKILISSDISLASTIRSTALPGFKNLLIEGNPVETEDKKSTRAPRLQKTFGSNNYLALLDFSGWKRLVIKDLQVRSDRPSGFATALKLSQIADLSLERVNIHASDAAHAFNIGLVVESAQGHVNSLTAEASFMAASFEASRLNFLGGLNTLSGQYGFVSSNSALYWEQLSTLAKVGGEFWNGSGAYIDSLKVTGGPFDFTSAFDFQEGYSRLVVKKAELENLFTPINIAEESVIPETTTSSRVSLLATCTNVQAPSRTYCK